MAESQGDVYVRKDVFEARMDRMEMLLEKTVLEIKSYVDKSTGEMKTEIAELRNETKAEIGTLKTEIGEVRNDMKAEIGTLKAEIGEVRSDIKVLTARIASLENVFYWGLGGFAVILASSVLLPAILGFLKHIFRPKIDMEEIKALMQSVAENVVNKAIAAHLDTSKRGGE